MAFNCFILICSKGTLFRKKKETTLQSLKFELSKYLSDSQEFIFRKQTKMDIKVFVPAKVVNAIQKKMK